MPLTFKTNGKECTINDCERTETDVYTRVMGYFAPIRLFNIGKKSEHKERKYFNTKKSFPQEIEQAELTSQENQKLSTTEFDKLTHT